jgi:lambda family phage portal protein
MDITAGSIEELPYGYEFAQFDPKFPHEQHQPFLKAMLRKISTGLGLSYNSFANDLEGVNYSSMRSGLQNERSGWMMTQSLFREAFLLPVYEAWLKSALNCGALSPLYPSNYEKYLSHYFQGRRWSWVSPKEDVESAAKSEQMGYSSKVDIVNEKGGSVEDIFRDRQYVKKLALKYGCPELTDFLDIKVAVSEQSNNADPGAEDANKTNTATKEKLKLAS